MTSRARIFHELMTGVLDELKLYTSHSAKIEVNLDHVTPHGVMPVYTNLLLRSARHSGLAEAMAVTVPCMQLYAHIGNELTTSLRPERPYEDWIKTYSGDELGQLCAPVESLFDKVTSDLPPVNSASGL